MIKNFLFIILVFFALTNCSTFNEVNEKAKGDGIPYIPGI